MQQRTWTHMYKDHSKLQRKPTQLENYKRFEQTPQQRRYSDGKKKT